MHVFSYSPLTQPVLLISGTLRWILLSCDQRWRFCCSPRGTWQTSCPHPRPAGPVDRQLTSCVCCGKPVWPAQGAFPPDRERRRDRTGDVQQHEASGRNGDGRIIQTIRALFVCIILWLNYSSLSIIRLISWRTLDIQVYVPSVLFLSNIILLLVKRWKTSF